MPTLFWDASGLAKYYTEETESITAEALVSHTSVPRLTTTLWGYSETFSLLTRRHNDGRLSKRLFADAVSRLRNDILVMPLFDLISVTDADILYSITYIQRHNVNVTDAALLATLLRYAQATGENCALVVADGRFCRAALAEGLAVINPENLLTADVPTFRAAL